MNRIARIVRVSVLLLVGATGTSASASQPMALAMTGRAVPELAAFDRILGQLMQKWEIPGGALAVGKDGRLILSRGYGLADVEAKRPVQPDALFRIASISKPITAAAVLVLVQQRRLDLDAKAVDLLGPIEPLEGRSIDPRFGRITVRQLLHHTGGFDRQESFDPMFPPRVMTEAVGTPADSGSILRFMLGRPLDFDPGARYAYSNFGYCLLGRILERVTGESYQSAVEGLVLRPAGISHMRLGRTRADDRAPGEVCYYAPGASNVRSVFPDVEQPAPLPYGGFYIEAMDAHGGWLASAADLVRFTMALDGSRQPALLQPATVQRIESRPAASNVGEPTYYGLGWMVRPVGDSANWWHTGSLPGTTSLLVRSHHGLVWAVVFNCRPEAGDELPSELDRAVWEAVGQVKQWPEHDLFKQITPPEDVSRDGRSLTAPASGAQ